MKLHQIIEMALRGGDLTKSADDWAAKLETLVRSSSDHREIGKIDTLIVKNHLFTYTVWDGDRMVMAARVDIVPNYTCKVDDVWVKTLMRGKKMFVKFLLFLKIDRNQSRLEFGDVHSDETYSLLKADGLKAFKKHWENSNGEVQEFSFDTIDKFYGAGRWRLILENTTDLEFIAPREGFTRTYESLLNALNNHEEV